MAKVKLGLQRKSDANLSLFCNNHQAQMDGNANFPAPMPDVVTYDAALTDYNAEMANVLALEDELAAARARRKKARDVLEKLTTERGDYVNIESKGEAAKVLSSGFDVRGPSTPIGELAAPINLASKMGTMDGEIRLSWKTVSGARSYLVDHREHDVPGSAWELVEVCTAARLKVGNLVPGTRYAFRVRGVGAAGPGPWSDETAKMAP
ncbi:MAG: fibronectin type III domain-containing protein [Verrucomicrobiae bacterium]|nr:fibronectin type III domain-containing protein [Verrucomicrobiae bacterium]